MVENAAEQVLRNPTDCGYKSCCHNKAVTSTFTVEDLKKVAQSYGLRIQDQRLRPLQPPEQNVKFFRDNVPAVSCQHDFFSFECSFPVPAVISEKID